MSQTAGLVEFASRILTLGRYTGFSLAVIATLIGGLNFRSMNSERSTYARQVLIHGIASLAGMLLLTEVYNLVIWILTGTTGEVSFFTAFYPVALEEAAFPNAIRDQIYMLTRLAASLAVAVISVVLGVRPFTMAGSPTRRALNAGLSCGIGLFGVTVGGRAFAGAVYALSDYLV